MRLTGQVSVLFKIFLEILGGALSLLSSLSLSFSFFSSNLNLSLFMYTLLVVLN